jgi:WXG100 family type VII secretion target
MKSEHEIYMDFQKAKEQAARLRQIASNMNNVADDELGGAVTKIRSDWTGENSEAYIQEADKEKQKINKTAQDLRRVAETIETIAARIMEAELAAIRIARN